MNKDLEIQFKAETGNCTLPKFIEAVKYRDKLSVNIQDLNPEYFENDDSDYYLLFPDPNYINWLEEKVIQLQKINQSEKSCERGAFRNF
jgi:hypothetical protein